MAQPVAVLPTEEREGAFPIWAAEVEGGGPSIPLLIAALARSSRASAAAFPSLALFNSHQCTTPVPPGDRFRWPAMPMCTASRVSEGLDDVQEGGAAGGEG